MNAETKDMLVQVAAHGLNPPAVRACIELHDIRHKLHRIAENQCNGWPRNVVEYRDGKRYEYPVEDEVWSKRDLARKERLLKKALDIAKHAGLTLESQGDPRGNVLKVYRDGQQIYI